jgi:hypothetical protein
MVAVKLNSESVSSLTCISPVCYNSMMGTTQCYALSYALYGASEEETLPLILSVILYYLKSSGYREYNIMG